ncbi:MAG TPA: undecaprenyl-diphosphate phosphatase [Acidobacteriota bacterium]|nr:undecaprenyl-diphosphate phosphatase [Acidobacteriota bacterium]
MLQDPVVQALLLGILQGLTEFLPISSSGHLLLLPWLLGWKPMGLAFDVMLHVGTLAAVLVYFRRDWMRLAARLLGRTAEASAPGRAREYTPTWGQIIAASLPAALAGAFLKDFIEQALRGPEVVVFNLIFFGLLLGLADLKGSQERGGEALGLRAALLIGLAQALALAPGVSRSGITITAALLLGFRRWDAARFSFIIATPLIAGAATLQSYELLSSAQGSIAFGVLAAGMTAAALSGWLCIKYFLRYLQSASLMPFVLYRLALGALALILLLTVPGLSG